MIHRFGLLRRRRLAALVTVSALVVGGSVASATTVPPSDGALADGDFAVPADRVAALDDAGLSWVFGDGGYPAQPDGVAWPTEEWPTGPLPDTVDQVALKDAIDVAFAPVDGAGGVQQILVVQGGQVVLDEHRDGYDPTTSHFSWSMAKSITHAMMGILVSEGRLDVFAPAPVPEWSDPSDPRHAITIDDLLRMRSGLEWNEEYGGQSDVITMLFGDGKADRGHYAADKPLTDDPGTRWSYSTGTSMILARIIADQVGYGDEGTTWAQDNLFGPLGITSVQHDLDGIGTMSGGSNINMTADDFARFGMLYLRGGNWDGDQIVPEAWVDYAHLPPRDAAVYGAQWWIYGSPDFVPTAFAAEGFGGQFIVVIPELDMVVVVLSDVQDDSADIAVESVIRAFLGS